MLKLQDVEFDLAAVAAIYISEYTVGFQNGGRWDGGSIERGNKNTINSGRKMKDKH